jgi:hypothetical protein
VPDSNPAGSQGVNAISAKSYDRGRPVDDNEAPLRVLATDLTRREIREALYVSFNMQRATRRWAW